MCKIATHANICAKPLRIAMIGLIIVQSACAVIALGSAEIPIILNGAPAARIIAAMILGLLIATVVLADMAEGKSLARMAALKRARSWLYWEHLLFVTFVVLIEGTTFGAIIYTLDTNPSAILAVTQETMTVLPTVGFILFVVVGLRALLTSGTGLQLYFINIKIGAQPHTLDRRLVSIIGGAAEEAAAQLHIEETDLAELYAAFARVCAS